jgi:two-component system chemotaxis sensor kinase CheA
MEAISLKYKEAFINESRELLNSLNQLLIQLENNPNNTAIINDTFRYLHNIKGMAATMGFEKITKLSHELESIMEPIRKGEKKITSAKIAVIFSGIDWLEVLINGLTERVEGKIDLTELFDSIKAASEEKEIYVKDTAQTSLPIQTLIKPTGLRIDIKILDDLINQIGELIISKNKLQDIIVSTDNSELSNLFYSTNKVIVNLENTVLKTRIVSVDYLFSRFPRMLRDLARETKKEVNFSVEGKEIGLDREILDELYEPIIHILRNSIYHGIEEQEERKNQHKETTGNIAVSALKEDNFVLITIKDDGRGMNIEKIKETAIKKGLISGMNKHEITDKELIKLTLLPGFSTASKIDRISGRGVGLDIVKNKIESLNGNLEIESIKDKGCIFRIKVPLTLAIIQALIVESGNQGYAIPFSEVKEVTTVYNRDSYLVRNGKNIPIVKLARIIGIPDRNISSEGQAVILKCKNGDIALQIDKILTQCEIVVKPISKILTPLPLFSGAAILGNGEVAIILDISSLTDTSRYERTANE